MSKLIEHLEQLEKSRSAYNDAIYNYGTAHRECYITLSSKHRDVINAYCEIRDIQQKLEEFGFKFDKLPKLPEEPKDPSSYIPGNLKDFL